MKYINYSFLPILNLVLNSEFKTSGLKFKKILFFNGEEEFSSLSYFLITSSRPFKFKYQCLGWGDIKSDKAVVFRKDFLFYIETMNKRTGGSMGLVYTVNRMLYRQHHHQSK